MRTKNEIQVNRVSKKFYAEIVNRVNMTFGAMSGCANLSTQVVEIIDRYISDGVFDGHDNEMVMVAFLMLKPEIDKAATRSRRARELAARRKSQQTIYTEPIQPKCDKSSPTKSGATTITKQRQKPLKKFGVKIVHRKRISKRRRWR